MIFILINSLILISFYLLTARIKIHSFSERMMVTIFLWMSQIIFTELTLGILSLLYIQWLALFNILISISLLFFSLSKIQANQVIREDIKSIRLHLGSILAPENKILLCLGFFVMLWFTAASYFLPPRGGADDIFYHLPPVYEFIIKHQIYLMPIYKIKYTFAFPLNAELFFMWPAIFFHDQRWVDFVQVIFALSGSLTVYAFARLLGQTVRLAFFLGLLFFFSPVVLHQAESNYIDLISTTFFMTTLYFSIKFALKGATRDLYFAGICGGILLGIKYFFILFWISFQGFILPRLLRLKFTQKLIYLTFILIFCGYWYLRNFLILDNIFYPITLFKKNLGVFFTGSNHFELGNEVSLFFLKLYNLYFKDLGLGTFNGGFGLVYWSIAFPCWIYILGKSILYKEKNKLNLWLFWSQPIIGFGLLLLTPVREMEWSVRWIIFVIPIGLLALGEILTLIDKKFSNFIKFFSVTASYLSVMILSLSSLPNYIFTSALDDSLHNRKSSEFRYYKDSSWYLPFMRFVAEPLDFLTPNQGLLCYIAADPESYWLTNIYGSRFQNRVWNLENNLNPDPDAIIFQNFENKPLFYLGKKITLEQVEKDSRYSLITQTNLTLLFIRNDILNADNRLNLLKIYYENTFPESINHAKSILQNLNPDIPIIAYGDIAEGLSYLKLNGEMRNSFYWVTGQKPLTQLIKNKAFNQAYTFYKPIENYNSEIIRIGDKDGFPIYKNSK